MVKQAFHGFIYEQMFHNVIAFSESCGIRRNEQQLPGLKNGTFEIQKNLNQLVLLWMVCLD